LGEGYDCKDAGDRVMQEQLPRVRAVFPPSLTLPLKGGGNGIYNLKSFDFIPSPSGRGLRLQGRRR